MKAQRILVLGGHTGIGFATVQHLKWNYPDAQVTGVGKEDFDIRTHEGIQSMEGWIATEEPTHLVYAIGDNKLQWIDSLNILDAEELMKVNVWGFINTLQICRDLLDWPLSVVAVTSDAAWRPMRTSMAYCVSKAALEMAVKVASREFAVDGWRINAVAPGKVADTPMTEYVDAAVLKLRGWSPEHAQAYENASSALGRPLRAEEVAATIASVLMTDAPGWTGSIVGVNGGR